MMPLILARDSFSRKNATPSSNRCNAAGVICARGYCIWLMM